jgi:hypothetical protein
VSRNNERESLRERERLSKRRRGRKMSGGRERAAFCRARKSFERTGLSRRARLRVRTMQKRLGVSSSMTHAPMTLLFPAYMLQDARTA